MRATGAYSFRAVERLGRVHFSFHALRHYQGEEYLEITARLVAAILAGRVNNDDVMFARSPLSLSSNIGTYQTSLQHAEPASLWTTLFQKAHQAQESVYRVQFKVMISSRSGKLVQRDSISLPHPATIWAHHKRFVLTL